jgi:hypothetical protein
VAVVVLAGVGATVAAAGGSREPATVRGAVFLGPLCGNLPSSGERTPCRRNYRPLRARIRFVRTDGPGGTRSVRSRGDGRFAVRLAAGRYRVEPAAASGSSGASGPRTLTLTEGAVADLILDSPTGES